MDNQQEQVLDSSREQKHHRPNCILDLARADLKELFLYPKRKEMTLPPLDSFRFQKHIFWKTIDAR